MGCAGAGNAGNVFPATDFKGNRWLAIRHATRHVRHARAAMHVGIANSRWRGKRSRHSRRMHNPQCYVSGKRPLALLFTVSLHNPNHMHLPVVRAVQGYCQWHSKWWEISLVKWAQNPKNRRSCPTDIRIATMPGLCSSLVHGGLVASGTIWQSAGLMISRYWNIFRFIALCDPPFSNGIHS